VGKLVVHDVDKNEGNKSDQYELNAHAADASRDYGNARGMQKAAAAHWGVDRRTIHRGLAALRQRHQIGRGVFRAWRENAS